MLDGEGADIVRRANAGLTCSAGDSEGLADAVRQLDRLSVEDRQRLGACGKHYCEQEFGRTKIMDALEELLLSVGRPRRE
jgi:glycosyltransferase involved in cell wall biosynthesis